jgi:kynurenine formamidase
MSNWGRWGDADELGALNLLTSESVLRALSLPRSGEVFSLSIPIQPHGGPVLGDRQPVLHLMALDGGDYAAGTTLAGGASVADDYVVMATHTATHIDALSHVWSDGLMYNGHSGNHVRSTGAARNGIEKIKPIVARGVMLDVASHHGEDGPEPGYRITADDLDSCVAAQGVDAGPGDVVLIRMGWLRAFTHTPGRYAKSWPGLDASVVPWFRERDVVAVGTDGGMEPRPAPPEAPFAIHVGLIRELGVHLMELVYLEELAERGIGEFLFVACPLKIKRAVGSPLNPIAIA